MRTSFKWDSGEVSAAWHRAAGGASSGLAVRGGDGVGAASPLAMPRGCE